MGIQGYLDMRGFSASHIKGFIGSQLVKMRRNNGKWQANNESVFDSIIYPLSKATEDERRREREARQDDPEDPPWGRPEWTYLL